MTDLNKFSKGVDTKVNKDVDFKVLSDKEHVLLRSGMYIGSTQPEEYETFISGKWDKVTYSQGLVKIINEVIDNAVDEHIRTDGNHASNIKVTVKPTKVIVEDDGRGIPLDEITMPDGTTMLRPVAAWTQTKAGSNFDDSKRIGAGTNGVGSALTNFFSKSFKGITCDGKEKVTVACKDNADSVKVTSVKDTKNGTKVEFTPDFKRFNMTEMDESVEKVILSRLELLQVCYPAITFKFNGKRISTNNIKKYAKLFGEPACTFASSNISWFLTPSPEHTFRQMASVNGLHNSLGGSHVNWFMNALCKELIPLIKRKYKVEVPASSIKNGIVLGIFIQNFEAPEFDSQTKERLKSTESKLKAHCPNIDFAKIAKMVMRTEEIISPIVDVYLARKEAAELRAAAKLAKTNKRAPRVEGHIKAGKEGGEFYLAEGLSAIGYLMKVRDKNRHGGFPLKGKVKNVHGAPLKEILNNKEYVSIMGCLGLDLSTDEACLPRGGKFYTIGKHIVNENDEVNIDGEWVKCRDASGRKPLVSMWDMFDSEYAEQDNTKVRRQTTMFYSEIHILTDADIDGVGSIAPGLLNFFWRWPDLYTSGRIKIVRTPIIIGTVSKAKDDEWFYDLEAYRDTVKTYSKVRYIKGLGSLTEKEYKKCIDDSPRYVMSVNNPSEFDLLYSKGKCNGNVTLNWEDRRKEWLMG